MNSKMRKTAAVAALLLSAAAAWSMPKATRCEHPPVLDGKLDDPCWKTALKLDRFYLHGGGDPDFKTCVMITFDAKNIYFGIQCGAPAAKKSVKAEVTKRDGKVYADDSMEIMIDANRTEDHYFHFIVNAKGVLFDALRGQGGIVGDGSWNSEATAAAKINGAEWTAEVKVPFHTLELQEKGDVWGFNFGRNVCDPPRMASIIPGGIFHNAGKFIPIAGFDIDPVRFAWKIGKPQFSPGKLSNGKLNFSVRTQIGNPTASEQEKIISLAMIPKSDPRNPVVTEQFVKFAPRESKTVNFTDLKTASTGDFRIYLSVREVKDRRLQNRKLFTHNLQAAPLTIHLVAPCYRNAIFASQNLKEVVVDLKSLLPQADYTVGIRDLKGKILCSGKNAKAGQFRFPVNVLPEGKMEIFAEAFQDGKKVASATHPLRKLAPKKGEVWRDEEGFWRRDGKRIWIIAEWGDHSTKGLNASFYKIPGLLYFDPIHAWGYPQRKAMRKKNELSAEDEALLRKYTAQHKDYPELFAYFLVDEPDCVGFSPKQMKRICDVIRDEDPYHPIEYNTYGKGLDYYGTGEFNGLHFYPTVIKTRKRSNFLKVAEGLRSIRQFNAGRTDAPSIGYFTPGYNNGDCGTINSRIYTFDETRTENLMAIIMGGRASMFYVWTGVHYPELYIGNTEYIKEIKALEPVLLTDNFRDPKLTSGNPQIEMMVKKVGSEYWIFAGSMTKEKQTAKFNIPGLGSRKLNVFREARSVQSSNDSFTDRPFDNFDVRIYTTDSRDFGLKTLAEVEKEIEAVHAKQKKPGNLAYQRYERDSLRVFASSSRSGTTRHPECTLWHITDGVTSGPPAKRAHGAGGVIIWRDRTPKKVPDWIELRFDKPVTAGRAVVYPALDSLRDYEIQVWKDGNWKTVGSVKNASGKSQTVTFPQVSTDRIRLYITANNGPDSALYELEIYEK